MIDIEKLEKFKGNEWDSQWAGSFPVLSFSYWLEIYTSLPFSDFIDRYVSKTIVFYNDGKSNAYQTDEEKRVFGKNISNLIEKDEKIINFFCDGIKKNANILLSFIEDIDVKKFSFEIYKKFQKLISNYYKFHIPIKVAVDYFTEDVIQKTLNPFEEARVYAEHVFEKSRDFIFDIARYYSEKENIEPELILAMVKSEFEEYLKTGVIPPKEMLSERHKKSAYLFSLDGLQIISGEDVSLIEEMIYGAKDVDTVKGNTAYGGKVKGTVKIVPDPTKANNFENGDILVAPMTRPDYLPLMEKSAAVVTDGGGILCHAAIVAREMKIPCVVGTNNATKILRDGDLVEVDADKGIIRKL